MRVITRDESVLVDGRLFACIEGDGVGHLARFVDAPLREHPSVCSLCRSLLAVTTRTAHETGFHGHLNLVVQVDFAELDACSASHPEEFEPVVTELVLCSCGCGLEAIFLQTFGWEAAVVLLVVDGRPVFLIVASAHFPRYRIAFGIGIRVVTRYESVLHDACLLSCIEDNRVGHQAWEVDAPFRGELVVANHGRTFLSATTGAAHQSCLDGSLSESFTQGEKGH